MPTSNHGSRSACRLGWVAAPPLAATAAAAAATALHLHLPCPSCSLSQLEEAQGGADPEARARLEELRRQLGALEEAQERAAHHEGHPHRPLQELPGGSGQGSGNSPPSDPAAMLQQMDG